MKSIYEQAGGTYRQEGDHRIPDLELAKQLSPGLWGRRYLRHLKEHHYTQYTVMLLNGTLFPYAAEIDRQATERMALVIGQTAQREGITEQMNAEDPMEWVGRMNEIRARAEQTVISELIYN